ncbi:Kelch-like protein 21 [Lamellibrachia satsuma]|nr:Kelch-like protein 21 [Lamellibrachia satsuma]
MATVFPTLSKRIVRKAYPIKRVVHKAYPIERVVDKAYQNEFMKGLHKMRQNEQYTDVTLLSGDVHFRCHRIVLEAASDYFKAMFRCGLEESTSATVTLTMEPEILTNIVDYMYTGEIQLTVDNVESLVKAGDLLQLGCLKYTCEDFMASQVKLHNFVEYYRFALLYRLDQLQKVTKQFVFAAFKTVALTPEFKELTCRELIEFIKDDDVNVEDEDIVFDAVLSWVRHDLDNRKSSLQMILEHVRLPYCTSNYLWHIKEAYDLLTTKSFEYIHEAMAFQADPVRQHQIFSCRTVPRNNFRMKSCLLTVGVWNYASNCLLYYKDDTNSWESLMELPGSVGNLYNVCCVDRGVLLICERKRYGSDKCWLFDLDTKKLEEIPHFPYMQPTHRRVSLRNCVYVVGGFSRRRNVLRFDLKTKQTSFEPELPQAVNDPMVVTYNNKIFVIGGQNENKETLCCAQVFDTTRRQWSTLTDMPDVCENGSAVTLNDSIYVVGGFNRTCLKYDPTSDNWTKLNQPRQSHGNAPAVVWRGSILVAWGDDSTKKPPGIERYDPLTDTWSCCSIVPLKEKLPCHCMINVNLYGV